MFSYAWKRLMRGRSAFLALFLSVALAATLFSGIHQGTDATSPSMLEKALLALATVMGLLVLSMVVPIMLAVRHASQNPLWRIEE